MKALLVTLVLIGLAIATFGQPPQSGQSQAAAVRDLQQYIATFGQPPQSGQSPLAPPKIPPPTAGGKSTTLKLGGKAPDFALPNGDGKLVILSEYTQRSPVVLIFYRGFW